MWNEYDNDSDGYPIVYADWSEELKEAKDIKDKMYVGIWDDAEDDFVEYEEFDDFQDALEFASKYDYSKIKSGLVKFDTNSLFTKGFASEFDIVNGKTDLKAMQELMPKKNVDESLNSRWKKMFGEPYKDSMSKATPQQLDDLKKKLLGTEKGKDENRNLKESSQEMQFADAPVEQDPQVEEPKETGYGLAIFQNGKYVQGKVYKNSDEVNAVVNKVYKTKTGSGSLILVGIQPDRTLGTTIELKLGAHPSFNEIKKIQIPNNIKSQMNQVAKDLGFGGLNEALDKTYAVTVKYRGDAQEHVEKRIAKNLSSLEYQLNHDKSIVWYDIEDESIDETLKESYDDWEESGIYGGDLTYCPICDTRLKYDEDGDHYCPKCKEDAHSLSMKRRHLMKESKVYPIDRAVEIYTTVLDPHGNLNSPFDNEEDYIEDLKDSFKNKQYAEYFISEYEDDDDVKSQEFVSLLKNIHSIKEAVDPTKAKEVKKNSDAWAVLYGYKFRNEPEVELEPEEHDEKSLRERINEIVSSYNGKGNRQSKNAKETDFIFYVLYR